MTSNAVVDSPQYKFESSEITLKYIMKCYKKPENFTVIGMPNKWIVLFVPNSWEMGKVK